ncbi:MAG: AMP-binding protein [Alphaproteobacteria bacterium]|nr:AMP-binding protein [Alphaproteobacteria bacterium]
MKNDARLEDLPPAADRFRRIEATPLPENLGALLDRLADEVPDRRAWDFFESGRRITYGALRTAVNRLANGFAAIGIGHGTHVGVMLPNIPELPLAWLALARIGAVMVPVNVRYTAHELDYVLGDSEASFLVVHHEFLPTVRDVLETRPGLAAGLIVAGGTAPGMHDMARLPLGRADTYAGRPPARDDLLNIQYTSGTTGFPKGCMLTHRYWLTVGLVHAHCDAQVYERILVTLPLFYMTGLWQLVMSFHQGAAVYVAARQSASRFMDWVRDHAIDFCIYPNLAYKQPPAPDDRNHRVKRANIYGFPAGDHAALEARFGFHAREGFGMTEIGCGMIVPLEAAEMVGSGSCGIPAPFRECRVADENGETVPIGAVGELLVRGPGILQGYYRKPEATAAAFWGDWFRTGDLFRQDERGWFYILGRTKDMVRRSGENIAAREVEAILLEIPEIAEAAVVPVPDALRGEEVKACLVLQDGLTRDDLAPERVIDHCRAKLAVFKVPRYLEYRTEPLPRTASGKVSKPPLLSEKADLRTGSWDRVDGCWR